jgi:polyhydroxyalkanoate synthesis repressor PhaR
MSGDQDPIIIKRYASRKLYDAGAKEYVTLEDIARYIREGRDVKILDKKSGEDLTRQYLVQIIADAESQGDAALPMNVLMDLVRHYQNQANALTPAFLSQMFEAFKGQQEKVMSDLGDLQSRVFDPSAGIKAVQDWQGKQAELFNRAMQGWVPGSGSQHAGDVEPDEDAKDRKIAEMQAELDAMHEKLKSMQ